MELLGPWERGLNDYVSSWIDVTPTSIPLESRKSFRKFSDSVKTEGDDDLASTVNEPFAPVLIDFEEYIGLREIGGMLAALTLQELHVSRGTNRDQHPFWRNFPSRAPAVVYAIVGAFAFTEIVRRPLQ